MNVSTRQQIEKAIVRKVAQAIVAAGYTMRLWDGEEFCSKGRHSDPERIVKECASTDQDWLYVYREKDKSSVGGIFFVYGNDGWDVVNDYHTVLEPILEPWLQELYDKQDLAALFAPPPTKPAAPHCAGHTQFEYDCIDCSDALKPEKPVGAVRYNGTQAYIEWFGGKQMWDYRDSDLFARKKPTAVLAPPTPLDYGAPLSEARKAQLKGTIAEHCKTEGEVVNLHFDAMR